MQIMQGQVANDALALCTVKSLVDIFIESTPGAQRLTTLKHSNQILDCAVLTFGGNAGTQSHIADG